VKSGASEVCEKTNFVSYYESGARVCAPPSQHVDSGIVPVGPPRCHRHRRLPPTS
jgi:hypothetical protein